MLRKRGKWPLDFVKQVQADCYAVSMRKFGEFLGRLASFHGTGVAESISGTFVQLAGGNRLKHSCNGSKGGLLGA